MPFTKNVGVTQMDGFKGVKGLKGGKFPAIEGEPKRDNPVIDANLQPFVYWCIS